METTQLFVKRSSPYGCLVLFFSAIFYFYEFWLQVSPGVIAPDLMQHYQISGTVFGYLATCYFMAYAGMQIPAGMFFDKFGPRRLLSFATICCALGTLLFATAPYTGILLLARFITGLGSAFAYLGALVLTANWFPPKRFAMLNGAVVTLGMLGAIFGEVPLAKMVNTFGWQHSLFYLGIAGLVLAIVLFLVVRDRPLGLREQHVPMTFKKLKTEVPLVFKNKTSWLIALYGVLMFSPTLTLAASWGVYFMMLAHHLQRADAAALMSCIFYGWAVGSPVFGAFSDKIGRRKHPMFVGSIGALAFIIPIIYSPISSVWLLGICMFLFGFFSSGFLPSFSLIREINNPRICGSVVGFMNMLNSIGGALIPLAIGAMLDYFWQGETIDNLRIYSLGNYHLALSLLPLCIIIALLILPLLPESYCRLREDK